LFCLTVGIYSFRDYEALELVWACRNEGWKIPEDVAIYHVR
jgi:hypothetical protein